jgi:predicted DNA-binding transcriptional regulator AlpA
VNTLLTEREVVAFVRLSRATVRRLEAAGKFPSRRRLSPGRVAWVADEVEAWVAGTPKLAGREITNLEPRERLTKSGSERVPAIDRRQLACASFTKEMNGSDDQRCR